MVTAALITAAELEQMPDGERFELVNGALQEMAPTGGRHGWMQAELISRVIVFVRNHNLGRVYTETGFILQKTPDTVLAPDLAFVRSSRLLPDAEQVGFLFQAPDLAVEIVSPGDRPGRILDKVNTYLKAGVPLVWTVEPGQQRVLVWDDTSLVRVFGPDEVLEGGDVLPGFKLELVHLFGSRASDVT